jgi:hypothetical protein
MSEKKVAIFFGLLALALQLAQSRVSIMQPGNVPTWLGPLLSWATVACIVIAVIVLLYDTRVKCWVQEWLWTGAAPNLGVASNEQAIALPDWPIHELFYHLRPDLIGKDSLIWQTVGEKVLDAFVNDKNDFLLVRGRPEVKTVPDIFFGEQPPLAIIKPQHWESARFTYYFINGDSARRLKHITYDYGAYTDVHVNKQRALLNWATPLHDPGQLHWPDFDRWDKEDVFRLFEVACLWNDIEPQLPLNFESNATFKKLRQAIYNQELSPYMDIDEAVAAAWNTHVTKEFKKDDAVTVNTKVQRDSLLEFAQNEGDRPRFLYPGARA